MIVLCDSWVDINRSNLIVKSVIRIGIDSETAPWLKIYKTLHRLIVLRFSSHLCLDNGNDIDDMK